MQQKFNYHDDPDLIDPGKILKETVIAYLKRIHWFGISILICFFFAYFKVQKIIPSYKVSAAILIKDDSNGSFFSEGTAFQDLGYGSIYYPIENEMAILKSRSLIQKVVRNLKLNITFFTEENNKLSELYEKPPFELTFLAGDSSIYHINANFNVLVSSSKKFVLEDLNVQKKIEGSFGSSINTSAGDLVITPKNMQSGKKYLISISTFESTVTSFAQSIQVDKESEYSNIILISLEDPNEFKGLAVINNLILEHQADAVDDKNQVSKNSAKFINERINYITNELGQVENVVQNYKSENQVFDVVTEKDIFLDTKNINEKELIENEMQLKLAEYVRSYIDKQNDATVLMPTNIGLSDNSIEQSVGVYNSLVLDRNRILKSSSEKNPVAINLEEKILSLQQNLKESLKKLEATYKVKSVQLLQQNRNLNSKISSLPRKEKELREIQRQQQIKESLYLYLLQKREETAITLALTVPNSKIIDHAYCEGASFNPNKKTVYVFSMFIGLIVPFVFFFIKFKFDTKINSVDELEKGGLKVLSEIPKSAASESTPIFSSDENSALAESFRLLRTNLDFLLNLYKNKNKVIVVTSTLPKEGKSFVTLNLAKSFSIIGKKVLVLGMDLRSPTLNKYIGIPNQIGVSNYIINQELNIHDIVTKQPEGHLFDLISSGDIPPNPAELLLHPRVRQLFDEAEKEYDYIIVDTAPVGVVTDTLLLNKYADLFVFIVRNKYLEKKFIPFIRKMKEEDKLRNMHPVLNYSDKISTYGYKYGYYYGNEELNKWKKFLLKIKLKK